MARPKGRPLPQEHAERIAAGQRERYARIRAMASAGEAVLRVAESGTPRQIAAVAQEQLTAVRESGLFRILPPKEAG